MLTLTAPVAYKKSVNDPRTYQIFCKTSDLWCRCVHATPQRSPMRSDGFTALRTGNFQHMIS